MRVSDFGAAKLHIKKHLMTVTGGSRRDDQTHNHAAPIAVKHMVDDCQIMLSELPAMPDCGRGEKKTRNRSIIRRD